MKEMILFILSSSDPVVFLFKCRENQEKHMYKYPSQPCLPCMRHFVLLAVSVMTGLPLLVHVQGRKVENKTHPTHA